ncbi:MAG: CCA tRNA nucleotidyltransferase [Elusimicrobia bacterium]|nr:CCA tRNA nucleotidyltransferase [Elusimicrobiota bacterium]
MKRRLIFLAEEARRQRAALYAVGGCVRDWLLGRRTFDIDLAVEGDSQALARAAARLWGASLEVFDRFGTVCLRLSDGSRVDFARARAETYERPAALPRVQPASIHEDLRRRDFTLNAMARRITTDGLGDVLDPFGGRADLKAKLLRVLHPKSFEDDPTRIFRAARYAARFGLRVEEETARLIEDAVRKDTPGLLSRERIRQELLRTLEEDEPGPAMGLLKEWGLAKAIHPCFQWPKNAGQEKDPLVRLGLCALWMERGAEFVRSLKLDRAVSQALIQALGHAQEERSPVNPLPELALRILKAGLDRLPKTALESLMVNGEDIKKLGRKPGKEYSLLLGEAASAQWRGEFSTRAQALRWLKGKLACR